MPDQMLLQNTVTDSSMRAVAISSHQRQERLLALQELVGTAGHLEFVAPNDAVALDERCGIILDCSLEDLAPRLFETINQAVTAGAWLLVLVPNTMPNGASSPNGATSPASHFPSASNWTRALPGRRGECLAVGEWFVKVVEVSDRLTGGMAKEFPIWGAAVPLGESEGWEPVLSISVGYVDRPVMLTRDVGAGRVTVSGLRTDKLSLRSPQTLGILRRSLSGMNKEPISRRPLGLAVIGYGPYGGMGLYHGMAARSTEGLEMVATVDPSAERRKAAEGDFPGLRAYAKLDELLVDDEVDVVVVATPPSSHVEISLALLEAGKHVACEKPLCFTVEEADQLIAAAHKTGAALTVNQNRRWDPDYLAIKRAVEMGHVGDLFNVETFVGGFEHPCRAWHSEESISGGAVYDWGSHHIDWIMQLMGDNPLSVSGIGHKRVWRDVTNLDQIRVRLAWQDGREAEFFQSDIAAVRRPKFYIQGTQGTLVGHYKPVSFQHMQPGAGLVTQDAHHAEAPAELTLARYEPGYGLTNTSLPPAPQQRYAFHQNLVDHLRRDEPLAVTVESVRKVIAILQASTISSSQGGRAVELSEVGL